MYQRQIQDSDYAIQIIDVMICGPELNLDSVYKKENNAHKTCVHISMDNDTTHCGLVDHILYYSLIKLHGGTIDTHSSTGDWDIKQTTCRSNNRPRRQEYI